MSGYEIMFKLGRFFLARDGSGWFLGKSMSGYYVALRAGDLIPFKRRQTRTMFWKELMK